MDASRERNHADTALEQLLAETAQSPTQHDKTAARQEALMADLESLPPLPASAAKAYLHGGYNARNGPPPDFDVVRRQSGKDIHGNPIFSDQVVARWKQKDGLGEPPPDVRVSSPESTLWLIRTMREAGWSHDETYAMMTRREARGTEWLLWFRDPDTEFDRCWEKAGIPLDELRRQGKLRKRKKPKKFVSLVRDQEKVYAAIHNSPGITLTGLHESGVLEGRYPKGRYKAAIDALFEGGLIGIMRGPHNTHFHFTLNLRPSPDGPGLDDGEMGLLFRDMAEIIRAAPDPAEPQDEGRGGFKGRPLPPRPRH